MDNSNIEAIVRQVLAGMSANNSASAAPAAPKAAAGAIPEKARVAMLVEKERSSLRNIKFPKSETTTSSLKLKDAAFAAPTLTNSKTIRSVLSPSF